ncbi:MAG: protein translocase subunit SecDF [Bacteroidetes bacterium]|nr:protein translocase subunit SecDF [Bacteroidota bacterium]
MKNKGFVRFLVIVLAVVCIYQLSFTLITKRVEGKARTEAERTNRSYKDVIDSLRPETVFNLGFAKFTYQECKQQEINLGLDLQGGMNVTLEISVPTMIRSLAGEDVKDPKFIQALEEAEKDFHGQMDFIDLFKQKYQALNNSNKGLGLIFYRKELKDVLPNQFQSTNDEIFAYLKKEAKSAVARTFEIVKTRIDQFGVVQPNVQLLDNGRILVELPGVDNPERVRRIITNSAKLEFWEVYRNSEAIKYLEEADKVIALKLQAAEEAAGKSSANKSDSGSASPAPVAVDLGSTDSTIKPLIASADSSKNKDSISKPNTGTDTTEKLTQEEAMIKQPLFARWYPNVNEDGTQWNNSAHVAYVHHKYIQFFDSFLNDPDVREVMPANIRFKWSYKPSDKEGNYFMLYALKTSRGSQPALDGDVVTNARPTLESNGEYKVSMSMNTTGSHEWKIITTQASEQTPKAAIAIVLDGAVYSAPTVNGPIPNGQSSIEGNFTMEDAEDLANILKAGKLDVPAVIVEETTVGPTLGQKAITAGLWSLFIGFFSVIAFMIFYYGRGGVYAVIALLANLFFILGVLAGFGAALTLPGMAGLVLTIGMAVDANVLIFERIKEELETGKGFKASVKQGYSAAYSSIVDANITTLIAAIILKVLGKGPVAGFGIILLIGILSSLFTSIALTRLFVERDIAKGRETSFSSKATKNWLKNANIDFIGNRKKFYIISSVIILAGIVSIFTKGLSTGVDFQGGWSYVVQIDDAKNTEEIRQALKQNIQDNIEVKKYGTDNQYKITTSFLISSNDPHAADSVKNTMMRSLSKFKTTEDEVLSESRVGPTIAEDIKFASTLAVIISLIGMFLYIVIRFRKFGYGLGATIALFHDVLIVFSVYSIFKGILPFSLDIDQAFIAAILTVVGYSINDTVVVFDRVREFLGTHKYETNTAGVINDAINQTLSRTLVTSLTTLLVVLILFLFGGEGLKGFTFAILIGVGVGTYSSICIATPIVVDFIKKKKK